MGRQIFILKSDLGNAGVAKIKNNTKESILSITLNESSQFQKECVIISDESEIDIGNFYNKRTEIKIPSNIKIDNIIIKENGKNKYWYSQSSQIEERRNYTIVPQDITFDNFFGGGFSWQRIRGNFIIFDYSIIHHILSLENVYCSINKAGYYCAGVCEKDGIKLIALAIPLIKDIINPFKGISTDIYKIKSSKYVFDVVCVGIDKTGEFFIGD